MDWEKASAELARKLNPDAVKSRRQGGAQVAYIEGWWAIAEANRIFGFDGWTRETVDLRCVSERERTIGQQQKPGWGVTYTAKVRITVGGVPREGCGAGHGIGVDLGEAHESAVKEAETDAMKRAFMTFGNPFGLALYDKDRANVGHDAPPYDAAGEAQRVSGAIKAAQTADALMALWDAEKGTLGQIKAVDAAAYQSLRDAFANRGAELKEAA